MNGATRLWLTTGFLLAALSAAPGLAQAQDEADEDARYHFELGQVAYNAGRFADAAREFEEAYRLSGRTALLYNIFLAYRDAGQLGPAIAALEKFLELEPDSPDAPAFRRRLANMRRLYEEQGGAASDTSTATLPTPVTAEPSTTEPVPPPASAEPESTSIEPAEQRWETGSSGGEGGPSVPGIVMVAVGGGLVVGGIITGVLALQSEGDLEDACGDGPCGPEFQDDIDQGKRRALITDILIPVGVVTAGVGVVLMVLGVGAGDDARGTADNDPAVDVACGLGGCAGSVTVRF